MGQRLRNIELDLGVLMEMLRGHPLCEVVTDIPTDAVIIDVHPEANRRAVTLTVESAAFDEVRQFAVIPNFNPSMTVKQTEMSVLADLVSRRHDYCKHCGEPLADDA